MKTVIKLRHSDNVRSLTEAQNLSGADSCATRHYDEKDEFIIELQDKIETMQSQIESLKQQYEIDIEVAKETIRLDVLSEIKRDDEAALNLLSAAIETMSDEFTSKLEHLDSLALHVSRSVLERVFHPSDSYSSRVEHQLRRQLEKIRKESILAIYLSGHDFSTSEALHELRTIKDFREIQLEIDPHLEAGDCYIKLRMGSIELSLDHTRELLKQYFDAHLLENEGI